MEPVLSSNQHLSQNVACIPMRLSQPGLKVKAHPLMTGLVGRNKSKTNRKTFSVPIHAPSLSACLHWYCRQASLSGCHLPCLRPDCLSITHLLPSFFCLTSLGIDLLEGTRQKERKENPLITFSSAFSDFNHCRKQTKYFSPSDVVLTLSFICEPAIGDVDNCVMAVWMLGWHDCNLQGLTRVPGFVWRVLREPGGAVNSFISTLTSSR